MSVTLSQLIDEVREELLRPRQASTPEAIYPFLFVEEVELEVGVTVSSTVQGGGKVNLQVVELGSRVAKANQEMHRLKIKMTPLLTKEEVRTKLMQNVRSWPRIEQTTRRATTKSGGLVGQEE